MPAFETTAHKSVPLGDMHRAHNWEYADATAREAATGFTSADLKKLALQLDDSSLWVLTATTPTWVQVGGGGGVLYASTDDLHIYDTADETSLFNAVDFVGNNVIPANTLSVGSVFEAFFNGTIWTLASSMGDVFIKLKINGVAVRSFTIAEADFPVSPGAPSGDQYYEFRFTFSIDTSDRIVSSGTLTIYNGASANGSVLAPKVFRFEHQWTSVTLSDPNTIDLTWQWQNMDSGNEIDVYQSYLRQF